MRHTLLAILLLAACTLHAQSLTPVYKDVDCGQLLFRTPATVTLELHNNTASPAAISRIDTGCGCAVPAFSDAPVAPGKSTTVTLTLDCKQLGHFTRQVLVHCTGTTEPATINVSGEIVVKIENYEGQYPVRMGTLLADAAAVEFDDVNHGWRLTRELHIMNPTNQNATPVIHRLPPYLNAVAQPAVLGPKQKGKIIFTLNSEGLHDYGLQQTTVYLGRNAADKVSKDKAITLSTVLLPHAVPADDVSRPYAAKLALSKPAIDLTALKERSRATDEITLTNNGRTQLEIRQLQMFTTGLQVELDNRTIQPGQTAHLRVSAKARDIKRLRTRPRLLMITNDPDRQKVVIEINTQQ